MNLERLRQMIAEAWPFVDESYPILRNLNNIHRPPVYKDSFILGHIALHQAKAAGQMAAATEHLGHGLPLDRDLAIRFIRNSIINALQYATYARISVEEIEAAITAWSQEDHNPQG